MVDFIWLLIIGYIIYRLAIGSKKRYEKQRRVPYEDRPPAGAPVRESFYEPPAPVAEPYGEWSAQERFPETYFEGAHEGPEGECFSDLHAPVISSVRDRAAEVEVPRPKPAVFQGEDLRRAVVMMEILSRPKALRRR